MKTQWVLLLAISLVACSSGGSKARPDGSGDSRSDGILRTDTVRTADSIPSDARPPDPDSASDVLTKADTAPWTADAARDVPQGEDVIPGASDAARLDMGADVPTKTDTAPPTPDAGRDVPQGGDVHPADTLDAARPEIVADVPTDRTAERPIDTSATADAASDGVPAAGEIRCGIAVCTAATTSCCPATTMMSRGPICTATCPLAAITCDGPEDCPTGRVCCSVENATEGFAGTSCALPADCAAPSRIVCHSPSDCPSAQGCAAPSPAPAAIAPPAGPSTWLVDFLVCRSGG